MSTDVAVQPALRLRSMLAPLQGPLLVALLYYLGAQAAFAIGTLSDKIFALFWPPNVILFCALMVVPYRFWWRYLLAAFPAHAIAEIGVGMPMPQLVVAFVTNCMVATLNAYLVRRFIGGPPWFGTFQKALAYIVVTAGISPALSALAGAFVPIVGGGSENEYWAFWSHWYFANALPCITIGSIFLIWFSGERRWARWMPSRRQIEPAVLTVSLAVVCMLVTRLAASLSDDTLIAAVLLLPLAPILWATVRYGEKGASGAVLVVTVILTWRSLNGPSLFSGAPTGSSVLMLQLFLMGLSIPVLLLGAVIDDLRRSVQVTRRLSASLMRAEEDERRRIARDLHDSTGQNLIAATLITGRIQPLLPATATSDMQQLEDLLQQSIQEVRTVSYVLHPPLLDEAGLEMALRDFVNGFSQRTGIHVDVNVGSRIGRLPPDTELVLFRVAQEALANVSRHAESATASVRLGTERHRHRRSAVLTIADAGKGIPQLRGLRGLLGGQEPRVAGRGVGLSSMRERLHQVGGTLEIESRPGLTMVKAVVPIVAGER